MIPSPEDFIKDHKSKPDIYNLELHESIELKGAINWIITRVEGGWIYTYIRLDYNSMVAIFVPEIYKYGKEGPG